LDILESIKVALEGIWVNKLRSALTMLGIIIGVAAVIAVVTIGQGGRAAILSSLESMGTNLFVVYPSSRNATTPITRQDLITLEDVEAIKNIVPTVKAVAPTSYLSIMTQVGRQKEKTTIICTGQDYKSIRNLELVEGRYFTSEENNSRRRVAVINEELAKTYFSGESALGKQVYLMNTPFIVIGVVKNDPSNALGFGGDPPKEATIPFHTGETLFRNLRIQIEGQTYSKEEVQETIDQIVKLLHKRHRNEGKYRGYSLDQEVATANKILGIIALIIGSIAGISLLVGGIGVMNIMLVSVTERTREIGIRMALGARRRDILVQFLIEAVVICLVGGTIGTILGTGGALAVALIAKWPPLITPGTIFIAFFFSASIGIFFGIYPANKAAKLDPIEALRYE
jgi:putative ABC transport system permease protein